MTERKLVAESEPLLVPGPSLYVYRWNRMGRKGQLCQVLVRGKRNSCMVEFLSDGHQAITSRNALRKARPDDLPILYPAEEISLAQLREMYPSAAKT